jgi:hypothetical protein
MKNYQMPFEEALRVATALAEARPGVTAYKSSLVADVLGRWEVRPSHPRDMAVCVMPGRRWYANPFGWQYTFWGMGEVRVDPVSGMKIALPSQAGDLIAMGPQSTGASMLAAVSPLVEARYPTHPGLPYDALAMEVPEGELEVGATFLKGVMERAWDEMNGYVIPCEVSWGHNLGKRRVRKDGSVANAGGLRKL